MDEENKEGEQISTVERGFEELRESDYFGDKTSLFLTAKGIKPASIIDVYLPLDSEDYRRDDFEKDIDRVEQMLEDLRLPFVGKPVEDEEYENEVGLKTYHFLVGKDEESLERLLAAYEANSDDYETFAIELGRALGYPETSIHANATHTGMGRDEYPHELLADPAYRFCNITLSREHWQEEMEYVRRNAEFIKTEDPALYDQITG